MTDATLEAIRARRKQYGACYSANSSIATMAGKDITALLDEVDRLRAILGERSTIPEEEQEPIQAMPRVNGKAFRCDCGCNVFTQVGLKFTCNACRAKYIGEK